MRKAEVNRKTNETDIALALQLDGSGVYTIATGCGFLNHMLALFARHGGFDLSVRCEGDADVDYHHSTEDIGIVLGQAFKEALGDMRGICRYGHIVLPMDEALVLVSLDISGRAHLNYGLKVEAQKVGDFDTELAQEFLVGLCRGMGLTLHVLSLAGSNAHHILEAMFKGLARALRAAVAIDAQHAEEIPSTKGILG